jgi:3-oxoacyl-[acyl-carrier-protein] synthase II
MLTAATLANWHALGVLARPHPDGGGAAVRPFDRARTGFAVGEGAAILVLEAHEPARARGATPIGEIVGYGASSDAFDLTEPAAEGQAEAMRAALRDAGVDGAAVGYLNAHGTATSVGDRVEVRAIREVFGGHADRLAVSSTKSMHGHLVGAAGALELAITLLGLAEGRVPPTANLTDPDPECDLDCVPLRGREVPDLEYALSNSFAFGGANVALLVRRVPV